MFGEVVLKQLNKVACHRAEMQPARDKTLVKVVSMPVRNDKPPHSKFDSAPFVLTNQRDNPVENPPRVFQKNTLASCSVIAGIRFRESSHFFGLLCRISFSMSGVKSVRSVCRVPT